MWAAWNSLITMDSLPQLTVYYIYVQNISLSSTGLDVAEMLRITQNVTSECSDRFKDSKIQRFKWLY